jgi:dephospho-CoA kinase
MSAQLPKEAYRALAARIVVNDGSLDELREKVFRLLEEVMRQDR